VFLAAVIAGKAQGSVNVSLLILVLVAALAAHISVNALNEYSDFRSGLDLQTERTPFSGGSGTLVQHPVLARQTLLLGVFSMLVVLLAGAYLVSLRGLLLLPFGLLGVLVVLGYTDGLTRLPWLCLIAAGLGFGPLMVTGSVVALTGEAAAAAWWAALPVFCVVNNLLLVNQLPDISADRAVGRRTLPVVYGQRVTAMVYLLLVLGAATALILAVANELLPLGSLLGLVALTGGLVVFSALVFFGRDRSKLLPYMALNVAVAVSLPVLMAAGYFIGG
jgi:1,4-dihydroxy-2-naphthoate octaprenyltransferase